jgi:choline dehydrogenase-like flavoprotein
VAFDASVFGGNDGPLQISYANYAGPFSSWMEPTFREMGIGQANGFNDGTLMGSTYCASTINPIDESRSSSEAAFNQYAQANSLPMQVYDFTMVKKILFDNKKATGVRVEKYGLPFTLTARNEVIISAGAFQTPQLLMVSGIGPAETLRKFNISMIKDAPGVGQDMQDHILFGPTYRVHVQTFTEIGNVGCKLADLHLSTDFLVEPAWYCPGVFHRLPPSAGRSINQPCLRLSGLGEDSRNHKRRSTRVSTDRLGSFSGRLARDRSVIT